MERGQEYTELIIMVVVIRYKYVYTRVEISHEMETCDRYFPHHVGLRV